MQSASNSQSNNRICAELATMLAKLEDILEAGFQDIFNCVDVDVDSVIPLPPEIFASLNAEGEHTETKLKALCVNEPSLKTAFKYVRNNMFHLMVDLEKNQDLTIRYLTRICLFIYLPDECFKQSVAYRIAVVCNPKRELRDVDIRFLKECFKLCKDVDATDVFTSFYKLKRAELKSFLVDDVRAKFAKVISNSIGCFTSEQWLVGVLPKEHIKSVYEDFITKTSALKAAFQEAGDMFVEGLIQNMAQQSERDEAYFQMDLHLNTLHQKSENLNVIFLIYKIVYYPPQFAAEYFLKSLEVLQTKQENETLNAAVAPGVQKVFIFFRRDVLTQFEANCVQPSVNKQCALETDIGAQFVKQEHFWFMIGVEEEAKAKVGEDPTNTNTPITPNDVVKSVTQVEASKTNAVGAFNVYCTSWGSLLCKT